MITLDLPMQTEQMIIQFAQEKGLSVQDYLISLLPEQPKRHSDWDDFYQLQERLYAESPEEFDNFDFQLDKRPATEREYW